MNSNSKQSGEPPQAARDFTDASASSTAMRDSSASYRGKKPAGMRQADRERYVTQEQDLNLQIAYYDDQALAIEMGTDVPNEKYSKQLSDVAKGLKDAFDRIDSTIVGVKKGLVLLGAAADVGNALQKGDATAIGQAFEDAQAAVKKKKP